MLQFTTTENGCVREKVEKTEVPALDFIGFSPPDAPLKAWGAGRHSLCDWASKLEVPDADSIVRREGVVSGGNGRRREKNDGGVGNEASRLEVAKLSPKAEHLSQHGLLDDTVLALEGAPDLVVAKIRAVLHSDSHRSLRIAGIGRAMCYGALLQLTELRPEHYDSIRSACLSNDRLRESGDIPFQDVKLPQWR